MRAVLTDRAVLSAFLLASLAAGVSLLSAPATAGETPGLDGFVLCTSKAPKETGYVKGSPVYLSGVFHVHASDVGYEAAYAAYLKHKYGFAGPLNCSVAYAKDGQLRTLDQRAGMAGSLAVRTGWIDTKAGAAPAPTQTPASQAHGAIGQSTYFVCTWPTSTAGVLTFYVSDVNGVPAGKEPGPFLGDLAPAFGKFVSAKYHPAGGGYNCVYQFSSAAAQALKQRYLTSWTPKGYKAVDTGWRFGQATSGTH